MDYPLWQDSGRRITALTTQQSDAHLYALSKSFPLALMKARSVGVVVCSFQRHADSSQHADVSASSTPTWGNRANAPCKHVQCGTNGNDAPWGTREIK